MPFTNTFQQLSKQNVSIAGGKGASLGEMSNAGFPVPPGFVVLASAFDRFLNETEIGAEIESVFHTVKHDDINSVEGASVKIRAIIAAEEVPSDITREITSAFAALNAEFVAVRSSATAEDSKTASWAGELESYLDVTTKDLLESVKRCWSSLFTPRALFYRFEKKLHLQNVSVAVVVQEMVQSEVSGICFTVHPVTKDRDQMVIEAGYGLGEAIVGGMITPDTYIVRKGKTIALLEKHISEQKMMIVRAEKGTVEKTVPVLKQKEQKLTDEQVFVLAALCQRIEKHYQFPQDIEWAFEGGKFFIVQSRPITTL